MTTTVPPVPDKVSADVEVVPDVADAGVVDEAPTAPAPNSAAPQEAAATAPDGVSTAAPSGGRSLDDLSAEIQELREALKQQMAATPGIAQGPQDEPAENFSLAQFMQSTLGR